MALGKTSWEGSWWSFLGTPKSKYYDTVGGAGGSDRTGAGRVGPHMFADTIKAASRQQQHGTKNTAPATTVQYDTGGISN